MHMHSSLKLGIFIFFFFISIQHYIQNLRDNALKHQINTTLTKSIALDKALFFHQKLSIFFLLLEENICCGYSLEAPHRGASIEYPQRMFSSKENYLPDTHSYLDLY